MGIHRRSIGARFPFHVFLLEQKPLTSFFSHSSATMMRVSPDAVRARFTTGLSGHSALRAPSVHSGLSAMSALCAPSGQSVRARSLVTVTVHPMSHAYPGP